MVRILWFEGLGVVVRCMDACAMFLDVGSDSYLPPGLQQVGSRLCQIACLLVHVHVLQLRSVCEAGRRLLEYLLSQFSYSRELFLRFDALSERRSKTEMAMYAKPSPTVELCAKLVWVRSILLHDSEVTSLLELHSLCYMCYVNFLIVPKIWVLVLGKLSGFMIRRAFDDG
jgi:hypothetical protein